MTPRCRVTEPLSTILPCVGGDVGTFVANMNPPATYPDLPWCLAVLPHLDSW
jgi:hypothetical protein